MEKETARFMLFFQVLTSFIAGIYSDDVEVWIKPESRKWLVAEGNRQVLDCYIKSDISTPANSLNWQGPNNSPLTGESISENNKRLHNLLTIESFGKENVGVYTCSYKHGLETSEAKIELLLVVENKLEDVYFYGNKSTTLMCIVEFPKPSVQAEFKQWLKMDQTLSQLKKPERFTGYENGTLHIDRPTRGDSGIYIAQYSLKGMEFEHYYNCQVEYIASPLVLNLSPSVNVVEGEKINLTCIIKGYPPAKVQWAKNGKEILMEKDSDRIQMTRYPKDEIVYLTIHSVNITDEGNYTCEADNGVGVSNSKYIIVRVKDKLEWLWPIIGILCEAVVLAIIIIICTKFKKNDHQEDDSAESEGLLTQRQKSDRKRV